MARASFRPAFLGSVSSTSFLAGLGGASDKPEVLRSRSVPGLTLSPAIRAPTPGRPVPSSGGGRECSAGAGASPPWLQGGGVTARAERAVHGPTPSVTVI